MLLRACPACEVFSNEDRCWCCNGPMLFGLPKKVSGGRPHVQSLTWVTVGQGSIRVEEPCDQL